MARQHSRHYQVVQLKAVVKEDIHRQLRKRRHLAVGRYLISQQPLRHIARADMEADWHIQLDRRLPQRIPMRISHQRQTIVLRLSGEENALVAHGGATAHLLHRGSDVPERNRGNRQQAACVGGGPLGLPIVVDSDAGKHQLGVIQFQELLGPKTAHIPIWSMYFNRALALYAPGCISSKVFGGLLKVPTPAVAVIPALARGRLPPTTHFWLPSASVSICGTRSRMLAGARLVQRSADSVTWVSASIMVYPLIESLLQTSFSL